jgi:hypothetical protein
VASHGLAHIAHMRLFDFFTLDEPGSIEIVFDVTQVEIG